MTTIAGVKLSTPLMNGACPKAKTLMDIKTLLKTPIGAVVVGSITVERRRVNPGSVYWRHEREIYSLNSYGLPNPGLSYYQQYLPVMAELAHAAGKVLIVNVIGFSADEFWQLIQLCQSSGVDMVELNFGCPNVWDRGDQKRIISYHADLVASMLDSIRAFGPSIKLAVKISPLPPDILTEVAAAITTSGIVRAVTATNTLPNAMAIRTNGTIDPGAGLAGLSGPALKPISLGVVSQLRQLLPSSVDIIGAGGVGSSKDVQDYLAIGAAAVQIVSSFLEEGSDIFERLVIAAP